MDRSFSLKIAVNRDLCQGHNRCKQIAPDLVSLDDYGIASVVGDGTVPEGQQEQARLAEANCPEFAISLVEAPLGSAG